MLALLLSALLVPQDPPGDPVAAWLTRLDALARNDHRHGTFGPTGKRLWITDLRAEPGLVGQAHWIHHTPELRDPLRLEWIDADGAPLALRVTSETWRPTHQETVYELTGHPDARIVETRWITEDDVFVSQLAARALPRCSLRWASPIAEEPCGDRARFAAQMLHRRANVDVVRGEELRIGAADAPCFFEAEAFARQSGASGRDRKRAASGGEVLGRDFGARSGHEAAWEFTSTGAAKQTLWVRFARANAGDARWQVILRGAPIGELTCASTGGWGDVANELVLAKCELGEMPAGLAEVALRSLHDGANTNFDAFVIAPSSLASVPPPETWAKACAPRLRGSLLLPAASMVVSGVPFALIPPRGPQGLRATAPIPLDGKGRVVHVLAVPIAQRASLACGASKRALPPRSDDPRAWLVSLPAQEDSLVAEGCIVLAITREEPRAGDVEERRGVVNFHGVRSEVRVCVRGVPAGEISGDLAMTATLEFSGDRLPGLATRDALLGLEAHRRRYASWFAASAPRFHCGDPLFDRLWTYRWFLVRHNLAWPESGNLTGPVVYEGRHGSWYPRVISFSTPHILAEARWLADPAICLGNLRAHRDAQDEQGVLRNLLVAWKGAHYTNWIPEAAIEALKARGDRAALADLLPSLARAVDADVAVFDGDHDALLAPGDHYATGMEFQPSFWFHAGYDDSKPETKLERVDFNAYHYGNAKSVAEAALALGQKDLATRMDALALRTRDAVLGQLWSKEDSFFLSARESDGALARCKEIVGFYPFRFGLAPLDADRLKAFDMLFAEKLFWTPFAVASCAKDVPVYSPHVQKWPGPGGVVTACMWNGPTWPHANSLVIDALARVVRAQPSPARIAALAELMQRFARFHCEDGDAGKLLLREYGDGESGVNWGCADYMHSTWNDLIIRHAAGIVPRFDDVLEVRPLPLGIAELACEDIWYHGHRVSVFVKGKGLRVVVDDVVAGEGSSEIGLFLGGAVR